MNGDQVPPMDCIEVVEVVTDYLERRLSEPERELLERHLALCEGCEVYFVQMRQTVTALGGLADHAPPADLDGLLAAYRERHPT